MAKRHCRAHLVQPTCFSIEWMSLWRGKIWDPRSWLKRTGPGTQPYTITSLPRCWVASSVTAWEWHVPFICSKNGNCCLGHSHAEEEVAVYSVSWPVKVRKSKCHILHFSSVVSFYSFITRLLSFTKILMNWWLLKSKDVISGSQSVTVPDCSSGN